MAFYPILHQTIISSNHLVWISCLRVDFIWLDKILWFWLVKLALRDILILRCDATANSRCPGHKKVEVVSWWSPNLMGMLRFYLNWRRRLVKLLVILGIVYTYELGGSFDISDPRSGRIAPGFTPEPSWATKSDGTFHISLSDHMPPVAVHKFVQKDIGNPIYLQLHSL